MIPLKNNPNVDNSNLSDYPDSRIRDNSGTGNGTPVNRSVYGDIHSNISKLMRLYGITPNGIPDNETNGYQIIESIKSLSTKNTIVANITTSGGVLVAGMKIGLLKVGEKMYCKALCDLTTETTIKGNDTANVYVVTFVGVFVTGDYLELVKTSGNIELRRVIDQNNISSVIAALNYLKKATQTEENAGVIDTKATTPLVNLVAFTKRVIGLDSGGFLATTIRNGLLSKEDKIKLDAPSPFLMSGSVLGDGTKVTHYLQDFTSTRLSQGLYQITHNLGITNYGVAGSGTDSAVLKLGVQSRTSNVCVIGISDDSSPNDGDFAFMIFRL